MNEHCRIINSSFFCLFLFFIILSSSSIANTLSPILSFESKNGELIDQKCLRYTRINPAMYEVQVDCIQDSYILNFKELFSSEWRVYFDFSPLNGKNDIEYTIFGRRIAEDKKNNYYLDDIFHPSIKDFILLPDSIHSKNGNFNEWLINKELIGYLMTQKNKISVTSHINQEYKLYIVFYGEVIKRVWFSIMLLLIVIFSLFFLFFNKKIINFNRYK